MLERLRTSFRFAECAGHKSAAAARLPQFGEKRHAGRATIARSVETCRGCTRIVPETSSLFLLAGISIHAVWKKEEGNNLKSGSLVNVTFVLVGV
jgi:hypothetical protein